MHGGSASLKNIFIELIKNTVLKHLVTLKESHKHLQSNLSNKDTEGTERSVRIREVSV